LRKHNYLRDLIDIFEEYGWDWTYHAFRGSSVWDLDYTNDYGDAAKPASSALNECLYDPEEWVRREATNLLRQIEAAAAAKAGVK